MSTLALLLALTPPPVGPAPYKPPLPMPKADEEGDTWDYAELLAYLNAKGLGLKQDPTAPKELRFASWIDARAGHLTVKRYADLELSDSETARGAKLARLAAVETALRGGPETVFAWGRFWVCGSPQLADRAAGALGVKPAPRPGKP